MTRWYIEKSGTGIEKSGTGIEKSGTGIEKSGTGIEKSGTGIEKSGTGIRKGFLACALAAAAFSSQVGATINPAGTLQLVVDQNTLAVSWIIDGSVFSGVSTLQGSYANLLLTEISVQSGSAIDVVGGGTGTGVVGDGTGSSKDVVGGGTGIDVVGGGTGIDVVGGGTGIDVVGGGTGIDVVGGGTGIDVVGGGTGIDVVGGGTGTNSNVLVVGGGTGSEAISITLPDGTGLQMEVSLGCSTASVSIFDANFQEVVTFPQVAVIGSTGYCSEDDFGGYDTRLPVTFGESTH